MITKKLGISRISKFFRFLIRQYVCFIFIRNMLYVIFCTMIILQFFVNLNNKKHFLKNFNLNIEL
jgi:hypothetical protein